MRNTTENPAYLLYSRLPTLPYYRCHRSGFVFIADDFGNFSITRLRARYIRYSNLPYCLQLDEGITGEYYATKKLSKYGSTKQTIESFNGNFWS